MSTSIRSARTSRRSRTKRSTSSRAWRRYFPDEPQMVGTPLCSTEEATYSVTKPAKAVLTIDLLRPYVATACGKPMEECVLTDGTACVGGDTVSFSRHFQRVHAVEYNKEHARLLRHNVRVYRRTNVTVHEGDYTVLAPTLKQDVVFLDPPWGGRRYKAARTVRLRLGNVDLSEVVHRACRAARLVVLKVPLNFQIGSLFGQFSRRAHPPFRAAHVHHVGDMALVVLEP